MLSRAHVELKNLEASGACSVVEVVDLEQINLLQQLGQTG